MSVTSKNVRFVVIMAGRPRCDKLEIDDECRSSMIPSLQSGGRQLGFVDGPAGSVLVDYFGGVCALMVTVLMVMEQRRGAGREVKAT